MSRSIFKEGTENGMGVVEEVIQNSYLPEKVDNGEIALTYTGKIAIRRKDGTYVVYNEEAAKLENQMNLVLDANTITKFIYLMPTQTVTKGDIVKIKETYYYVISENDNKLKAINLSTGTNSSLTTEINIITGTTTYKKVVNLIQGAFGDNTATGGFNPMMLLLADNKGSGIDLTTLMMMQSMNGGNTNGINPMMLLALKDSSSDLSTLMMMQAMGGNSLFGNTTTGTL